MTPHPLTALSEDEFKIARDVVTKLHASDFSLFFRAIFLQEPKKAELVPFLQAEHAGSITDATPRPPRRARLQYDVIKPGKLPEYTQSVVDLKSRKEVERTVAEPHCQTGYIPDEFGAFQDACVASQLFKDAMAEYSLPENFTVCIDPWPYGGPDEGENIPRYMQGLVFARDASKNNLDSNHYGYPIPIIPVMDFTTKEIVRVDRLATGGADDGLDPHPPSSKPKPLFTNAKSSAAEYVPELLDIPLRADLKPINITQPEGASFKIHGDNLIEWQKWRFRLGFTPREGAVLHDLCYDGRPVLYRLSYSELTVPYGDPRPPFQRKQAFDLGDGGFGRAANNLELGCDCLGAIHYLDAVLADTAGNPTLAKAVACLHEQDNGIGWKHTNFRTNRAVVTRLREFVVQCIVTLANYEYVFAYKLDTAGGITLETRATGIMSVVAMDEGKTESPYGAVVAPGVLAQNHQHIFAVRIDPAIDSYADGDTRVVVEESVPAPMDAATNPYGNYYEIRKRVVDKASWIDAEPRLNRVIKFENKTKKNAMSGRNVGFKLTPSASQLLLADEESQVSKRAKFARHHVWVTGYRDDEFWAAGEFTNQSTEEVGGVWDMVARGDWFGDGNETSRNGSTEGEGRKCSPVVWSVFGLTHNPRVEDWPVMPVEIHHMNIRPADFFTANPALDMPGSKNKASVIVPCCGQQNGAGGTNGDWESNQGVQKAALTHLQGPGPDIPAEEAGAHVEMRK
ncbi:copper amine oxidase 1 [Colletotrichum spaethianum]|uniref:Amine oxidase n=1 Tax=Colletotrichum spaethianum TaxID=700344 RepID=A0AA37LAG7_9PEZI|nr:copper amine oxidase 1 [Colletotrichum spaethianum]GKT42723.1 copper amine oxidase 1 [Colletotrichum spaethianum]